MLGYPHFLFQVALVCARTSDTNAVRYASGGCGGGSARGAKRVAGSLMVSPFKGMAGL